MVEKKLDNWGQSKEPEFETMEYQKKITSMLVELTLEYPFGIWRWVPVPTIKNEVDFLFSNYVSQVQIHIF